MAQSKAASWLLAKYSRAPSELGEVVEIAEVEHPEQVSKCGHPSEKASSVDASARVSATSEVTTVAARRTGDSARFRALALDAFLDASARAEGIAYRGRRIDTKRGHPPPTSAPSAPCSASRVPRRIISCQQLALGEPGGESPLAHSWRACGRVFSKKCVCGTLLKTLVRPK